MLFLLQNVIGGGGYLACALSMLWISLLSWDRW